MHQSFFCRLLSSNFLGTAEMCRSLIELLQAQSVIRVTHWDDGSGMVRDFSLNALGDIQQVWLQSNPSDSAELSFLANNDMAVDISFRMMKNARVDFIGIEASGDLFASSEGRNELINLASDLFKIGATDFGYINPTRFPVRAATAVWMDRVRWVNFYGSSYLKMIGIEKLKSCPYAVFDMIGDDTARLVVDCDINKLQELPNEHINAIKEHLGIEHFSLPNPKFSSIGRSGATAKPETPEERAMRIIKTYIDKGHEIISMDEHRIAFRGPDGSKVEFNNADGSMIVTPG